MSAPVDLEQFREAVEALLPFAQHHDSCGDHDAYNNASVPSCGCGLDGARDRLLSIIDSAGKVEVDASFDEWLAKEMPAGTVIGDPSWWADRIARQYSKRTAQQPAAVGDLIDEREQLQRWIAHLEAFIGPSALPTLRRSFADGRNPGGAAR